MWGWPSERSGQQEEQTRLAYQHKQLRGYHDKMAVIVLVIKKLLAEQEGATPGGAPTLLPPGKAKDPKSRPHLPPGVEVRNE